MQIRRGIGDGGAARIFERQMRNWEIARAQQRAAQGQGVSCFICISRAAGAGGTEIARRVGERLNWPVFDKQILAAMAQDDSVRTRLYGSMDERDIGWFEETFRALMDVDFHVNDYFHRLTETVLCLARQGPAVFVGRGANLILPRDRGLRVRIVASRKYCIQHFAQRNGISEHEAVVELERIENEREDWLRRHFHVEPRDMTGHDLAINIERFTSDQAVGLILAGLSMRMLATGITPVRSELEPAGAVAKA
jgi:cytidylate kinase